MKQKRKPIYVLDPKALPIGAFCKLKETLYWDDDETPIDGPEELRAWGITPRLGDNYYRILCGTVGILRDVQKDASIEDENGFLINDKGEKIDPGYEPWRVLKEDCKYAIVFNNCSWTGYRDENELLEAFTMGQFDVYIKDDK